jgi:hypothetical protein
LSWARSVVFEPKVLAAASLLKVSYEWWKEKFIKDTQYHAP